MLDIETSVPLHTLEDFPGNAKTAIHGVYRKGLQTSLEIFNICDRLKVWPIPGKKNRYYILDGHQRKPLIIQLIENRLLALHFGISLDEYERPILLSDSGKPDTRKLQRLRNENPDVATKIHNKAMSEKIDVLVMSRLTPDMARLFNLSFDRNRAIYDEAKVVRSYEQVQIDPDLKKTIIRPEAAFIQPAPAPVTPFTGSQPAPELSQPLIRDPMSDVPNDPRWGPPPPLPANPISPKAQLIPYTFSLTPEGYKEVNDRTLRATARLYREKQLLQALTELESIITENGKSIHLDDITIEIALLTLNRHKALETP